jgi:sigma-B regulation protein RsbU (phosphoserine phosphatase)
MLKEMSQCTDPGELVRLYFDHIRQNFDVQRALVVSRVGLSAPQFRLVHNVNCNDSVGPAITLNELRQGGLLAEFLYLGEFHTIPSFAPDSSDPAFDLLRGSSSLMAFPLFEKGASAGMVVALGSSGFPDDPAVLCGLATMTSLFGRAIESQKLATEFERTCRALDSELKSAADIQRWLLPSLPALDDIDIAASYRTAKYSGGDYYDVGRLPDGKLGVFIADVSGKGAAAAVLMAVLRSIVHDEVDRTALIGPAALLDYADSRLRAMGLSQRSAFVTAFCGVLNPVTGEFVYSCAGHNPPRVLRVRDRTVISLDGATTFPLGLVDEPHTHTEETITLELGDLAIFYTDGITEARSPAGEFFGVDRLDQLLADWENLLTPAMVIQAVAHAVADFAGPGAPADDQTLLAISECIH